MCDFAKPHKTNTCTNSSLYSFVFMSSLPLQIQWQENWKLEEEEVGEELHQISVYHAHLWQPACHAHPFLLAMDLLMKKSSLFKQQKSESETNSCIVLAGSVPADPTVARGTVFPISALLLCCCRCSRVSRWPGEASPFAAQETR